MRSRVRSSDSAPYVYCPNNLDDIDIVIPLEPTEQHNQEYRVTLKEEEYRLIEESINHLNTIVGSILGNLEDFDQFKKQVAIYNFNTNSPTGIHLGYSIYGEQKIQSNPEHNEFKQFYKLVSGNEFVKIHLNRDNSIQMVQTNIATDKPYAVVSWLDKIYKTFDLILNSPEDFYSEGETFPYEPFHLFP